MHLSITILFFIVIFRQIFEPREITYANFE